MRERRVRRLQIGHTKPSRVIKERLRPVDTHTPQHFQVSVNVLEAHKLQWSSPETANSYVIAVLGQKKNRTTTRMNEVEPRYGEVLLFDVYMSIAEIKKSSVCLTVMETVYSAAPRMIGEATVDLGIVWDYPNHQVYHQWVQMSPPQSCATINSVGSLYVGISITTKRDLPVMPAIVGGNKIEEQIPFSLPFASEKQRAKFVTTIHAVFGLSNALCKQGGVVRRPIKIRRTYVAVTFCGLKGRTSTRECYPNPEYNEQICIVEEFPAVNQVVRLEVCTDDHSSFYRVFAGVDLHFDDIAYDGENGYLPHFGPSLLALYGSTKGTDLTYEDGPFYKGSLLVSFKTIVPYYAESLRSVTVKSVEPIGGDYLFIENFILYCTIFEISMMDLDIVKGSPGIALSLGEITSEQPIDAEFQNQKKEFTYHTGNLDTVKTKSHCYVDMRHKFPVLRLAISLPDYRFRIYRNNLVCSMKCHLESVLLSVENSLKHEETKPEELVNILKKAVTDTADSIVKYKEAIMKYQDDHDDRKKGMTRNSTELDKNQAILQMEQLESVLKTLPYRPYPRDPSFHYYPYHKFNSTITKEKSEGTRKDVKVLLGEMRAVVQTLEKIINKTPHGWPDLVVWLVNDGKKVAYAKVPLNEIIYSVNPDQCGNLCGQLRTLYLKPLYCGKHYSSVNCHCIGGKIEVLLWMALFKQRHEFHQYMPLYHELKGIDTPDMHVITSSMLISCKANIYSARFNLKDYDIKQKSLNSFVRLHALGNEKDTEIKNSDMPTWNQVLTIQRVISTSAERMYAHPPTAVLEVYNCDPTNQHDFLGRFEIQPVFTVDPSHEPKLQWYEIYRGSENTGQIFMSILFLKGGDISRYTPRSFLDMQHIYNGHDMYRSFVQEDEEDKYEPIPYSLIPQTTSFKVDVYFWGLRGMKIAKKPLVVMEINKIVIKSDTLAKNMYNNNFPNGRITQFFESPIDKDHLPSIHVRLLDCTSFGRTIFRGANVIKHPSKFMVDWFPKQKRQETLTVGCVICSDFSNVGGQMCYVKNKSIYMKNQADKSAEQSAEQRKLKPSVWRQIFSVKETPEESISLLPVYTKNNNHKITTSDLKRDNEDWWKVYFLSHKHTLDIQDENHLMSDSPMITIYSNELEYQPQFSKFKDWCSSLKIYNGTKVGIPEKDAQLQYTVLKAGIAMYRWPPPANVQAVSCEGTELAKGFFSNHPNNAPTKHLVRVYLVKVTGLPQNIHDLEPYIVVSSGKRRAGDRKRNILNDKDLIIGKMHEFSCTLPDDYLLTVSLFDYDDLCQDELLGITVIDLENRIYSKHRAHVGLASEYTSSDSFHWRDSMKPSAILEDLCAKNHLPPPTYATSSCNITVTVNGVEYKDDFSKDKSLMTSNYGRHETIENICLSILRNWQTFPVCGYQLVPEHVETRSLYHPDKPDLERGKVQLWVDIFSLDSSSLIPPARNISPGKIHECELSVVVRKCLLVGQDNREKADVYLKTFLGYPENSQQTNIHHKSTTGKVNFSWRMIFKVLYRYSDSTIFCKKSVFSYVDHLHPVLGIRLMGTRNRIIGALSFNLNMMYAGAKTAEKCSLEAMESGGSIDLFLIGSVRGWWPLRAPVGSSTRVDASDEQFVGAINMELTLRSQEEALLAPVKAGPLLNPRRGSLFCCDNIQSRTTKNCLEYVFIVVAFLVVLWLILYFVCEEVMDAGFCCYIVVAQQWTAIG